MRIPPPPNPPPLTIFSSQLVMDAFYRLHEHAMRQVAAASLSCVVQGTDAAAIAAEVSTGAGAGVIRRSNRSPRAVLVPPPRGRHHDRRRWRRVMAMGAAVSGRLGVLATVDPTPNFSREMIALPRATRPLQGPHREPGAAVAFVWTDAWAAARQSRHAADANCKPISRDAFNSIDRSAASGTHRRANLVLLFCRQASAIDT